MTGDCKGKRDACKGLRFIGKSILGTTKRGIMVTANSVGQNLWLKIIQMYCMKGIPLRMATIGFAKIALRISRISLDGK